MKTKHGILAPLAFLLGVGGAYASLLVSEDIYVKARYVCNPDAPVVCINCKVECNNAGIDLCRVFVPLQSGGTATAQSFGLPFVTYRAGCIVRLFNSAPITQVCPLVGIERPCQLVPD
jgi:hypothetical protein